MPSMLSKMITAAAFLASTAHAFAPAQTNIGASSFVMRANQPTTNYQQRATKTTLSVSMDEVEDKVKSIIAEQLGVEAASVTPDASFTEDLGADSLDAVELIMAIEEAFDIEIPDEEAESMTSPAECVAAIKGKLG